MSSERGSTAQNRCPPTRLTASTRSGCQDDARWCKMIPLLLFIGAGVWLGMQMTEKGRHKWDMRWASFFDFAAPIARHVRADIRAVLRAISVPFRSRKVEPINWDDIDWSK